MLFGFGDLRADVRGHRAVAAKADPVSALNRHPDGIRRQDRLARPGDCVVILMGDPIREKPLTNLLRVHLVRSR